MKKIIALILALIMVMGLAVSASAASITITPADSSTGSITDDPTYTVYKIFDAVLGGELDTNPTDTPNASVPVTYTIAADSAYITALAGCFTFEDIPGDTSKKVAKINSGVTAADIVAALNGKLANPESVTATKNGDGTFVFSGLTPGYYVITSSVGSAMIVDTLEDVTVESKNSYPTITKTADKDTAAFGEKVTYTLEIEVPATAVGTITVHDTMTGLTYNGDAVAVADDAAAVTLTPTTGEDHTDCTVELTFDAAAVAGKTVTITYSANVAANEVTTENNAYITYANFTSVSIGVLTSNYKIDVFKYTGSDDTKTGLAGAGFVLKNEAGKYYKLTDGIISWVDSVDQATEYTTAEGNYIITFAGLANGTYTLVEKTVPAGYNKAEDQEITVEYEDFTGETQIEVLNNTGSELPSTGGMGTTLFYVFGGLMMAGAAVLLITKKRMSV